MREFININTGHKAIQAGVESTIVIVSSNKNENTYPFTLPIDIVANNSKDWTEITPNKVLMITEDGVAITDENRRFYSCLKEPTNGDQVLHYTFRLKPTIGNNRIYFSTYDLAVNYISRNKPVFSYNDLDNLVNNSYQTRVIINKDDLYKHINDIILTKSKI